MFCFTLHVFFLSQRWKSHIFLQSRYIWLIKTPNVLSQSSAILTTCRHTIVASNKKRNCWWHMSVICCDLLVLFRAIWIANPTYLQQIQFIGEHWWGQGKRLTLTEGASQQLKSKTWLHRVEHINIQLHHGNQSII